MTTQILAASSDEVVLAAAATEAGLLDRARTQVHVGPDDDLGAVAASLPDPGSDVELVVGTSALRLGRELTRRWTDARVVLLAGGAAAYGPTPRALGGRLARRTDRVLHLDPVPGLHPLLLAGRPATVHAVPLEHVRAVTAALSGPPPVPDPTTLVLGRTAAWTGALDLDQQTSVLVAMVSRCAEAGHSRIVLLLDDEPGARARKHLARAAAATRAELDLVVDAGPVAAWFALDGVRLVVGCADEELLVARHVYGHRVAQLDTEVVLRRYDPFADVRRTGASLVEATVPDLRSWTVHPEGEAPGPHDLAGLVGTVAYAMEPELLADRRAAVIDWLETHPKTRRRFVRRRRLTELRLPGGKRSVRAVLR